MRKFFEGVLERSEIPLLFLAVFAILFYLLQLTGLIPDSFKAVSIVINFVVDLIFLVDLILKLTVLGMPYVRGPWFVVDLCSAIPFIGSSIEFFGLFGPHLSEARVARLARIASFARITRLTSLARSARIVRVLRLSRGAGLLTRRDDDFTQTPAFIGFVRWGVPFILAGIFLGEAVFQNLMMEKYLGNLQRQVAGATLFKEIQDMPEFLGESKTSDPGVEKISFTRSFQGHDVSFDLSLQNAAKIADRTKGIFLFSVFLLLGGAGFLFSRVTQSQRKEHELELLSNCFSPSIVEKILFKPALFEGYFHQWVTVFFIDIHGFTSASEKFSNDIETLAINLRGVMDIAREEIVEHSGGIVDKFLGDAVMGWMGTHFSKNWKILDGLRQSLKMDELEAFDRDINFLERERNSPEIGIVNNGNGSSSELNEVRRRPEEIEIALNEARSQRKILSDFQKEQFAKDPELKTRYDLALGDYRAEVAKSAVTCALHILEKVACQEAPGSFRELKIGMASGPVFLGNFGAARQIGFTVLGPKVNLASRLESAASRCGCKILVDEETWNLLKNSPEFVFRKFCGLSVKGISLELTVFEPFFNTPEIRDFADVFNRAEDERLAGKFAAAADLYNKAVSLRAGGDPASKFRLEELKIHNS